MNEWKNYGVSALGLGTTGYWSGTNKGLDQCIETAFYEYGINVFDTAEMYGNGRCEEALGKAVRAFPRDRVFLISKILPDNVKEDTFEQYLDNSLARLKTDYIDLYLLHWRANCDLSLLVKKMEEAVQSGRIRRWGVSNFDTGDLRDLLAIAGGENCFCNQIFFNIYERGPETELLPFMKTNGILPMSYSSLGSGYHPHPDIHAVAEIETMCRKNGVSAESVMLKFNTQAGFLTLFSTASLSHLQKDLQEVTEEQYAKLFPIFDRAFPAPDHIYPLVKI